MTKKQMPIKNKLFKFRQWLTVPEAAKCLSNDLDEEVTEANVFRHALDGYLKLSVNFVNPANAVPCVIMQFEETEQIETAIKTNDVRLLKLKDKEFKPRAMERPPSLNKKILALDQKNYFVHLGIVITIKGVWDLSMVGNERFDVEHKYQMLTGGPEVTNNTDGTIVEREDGQCYALIEHSDKDFSKQTKDPSNYCLARSLPHGKEFVVRRSAIEDFLKRVNSADYQQETPLHARAKTTYLNIIGALLEYIKGETPGIQKHPHFENQAKLIDVFIEYGIQGLSKSNLEKKFVEAKRAFKDSYTD